jgi:RimJ/RimL family protein N-acetyltransferase
VTGGTQETGRLLTDRLDLRVLTTGDLHPLHRIISDPRNCVHIPEGPKESLAASRAWIERFGGRWDAIGLGYWTVRLRPHRLWDPADPGSFRCHGVLTLA